MERNSVSPNAENEETKGKPKKNKKWSERMKESFGKFVYKMNHSGGAFSQYNKLDFKNWYKKAIWLMGGHVFTNPTCKDDLSNIFKNIILFTYRKHFESSLESIDKKTGKSKSLNSDFGWGCMIRWGQMMLANALLLHLKYTIFTDHRKIKKSYRFYESHRGLTISDIKNLDVYESIEKEVISKFLDSKTKQDSPFSIHEVTKQGLQWFHKIAGDWYGTNSISQVLKELNNKYKPFEDFEIWVFNDGVVFKQDVVEAGSKILRESQSRSSSDSQESNNNLNDEYFDQVRDHPDYQSGGSDEFKNTSFKNKSQHSGGSDSKEEEAKFGSQSNSSNYTFKFNNMKRKWNKCVLIIVNTRLGLKKIPEEWYNGIINIFKIPQMVGIIGGKGKFGLYFVGAQKDNLILLDPHLSQETVNSEEEIMQNRETFRWKYIRTIKIKKVDPWIGVGFIIRSHKDFQEVTSRIEELNKSPNSLFGIKEMRVKPKNEDIEWHKQPLHLV